MSAAAATRGGGTLLPLALALLVVASAIAVVQVKHQNRSLTTRIEAARQQRESLQLEWAQLQLEEATLAQHGRVDAIARTQFGMVDPLDYQIVETAPEAKP
jgi:cell division protein FtsL